MQQLQLGFRLVTAEEGLAQQHALATEANKHAAQLRADRERAALLKRKPGRPRRVSDAHSVLAAASSQQAAAAADGLVEEQQPAKRGKYHNWSVVARICS